MVCKYDGAHIYFIEDGTSSFRDFQSHLVINTNWYYNWIEEGTMSGEYRKSSYALMKSDQRVSWSSGRADKHI